MALILQTDLDQDLTLVWCSQAYSVNYLLQLKLWCFHKVLMHGPNDYWRWSFKLKTKFQKFSELFKNVSMSYINYLSNSTFLYSSSISCCSAFSCCITIQKKWNFWKIPKSYTQNDIVFWEIIFVLKNTFCLFL